MTLDISGILDDVVHQFTDPLAFFRELVQNALDAGTREIEISLESPAGAGEGLTVATVRDFGCGMTRDIIETQLCRLFSSQKHGDYTKIGRFGIGFVSVYGIDPDWVCVDTGREGESWRIIFLPDRSWELRTLRHAVEGTTVRVAKTMSSADAADFRGRASKAVASWCAHVRVPVMFDGRDVRQPFDIDSACALEFEEEGTRVVAGLVANRSPGCAYYNRGLLLQKRLRSPWPHVEFKIDSRYLEHTLTRDDLLQDGGYHRALELLERLATIELPQNLLHELELAALSPGGPGHDELLQLLAALDTSKVVPSWRERKLMPSVGGPLTPQRCDQLAVLYCTDTDSPLARAVTDVGETVLLGDVNVLGALTACPVRQLEANWLLLNVRRVPQENLKFFEALDEQLRLLGVAPKQIWIGELPEERVAASIEDPKAAILQSSLQCRLDRPDETHVVLNAAATLFQNVLRVSARDPELAAAILIAAIQPDDAHKLALAMAAAQ